MKGRSVWHLGIGIVLVLVLMGASSWAVPRMINYQGMLTDKDGVPLTGTFAMRFYLYDALSGGNQLWNPPNGEEQSVSVTDGIYNVQLGSSVPLTDEAFSLDTVYLDVDIYNPDTLAWERLSPRQRITSVAYALRAGDAETLNGLDSTALDQSGHVTRTDNPHQVTAAQVGASTPADLASHAVLASAHHTKTTSFSELTDQATDAQIPNSITINYAATAGNANTVGGQPATSFSQVGHTHSGAEITSKVSDADKLDGKDSTEFASSGHNHDAAYVNVTGDSMSAAFSGSVLSATNYGTGTGIYGSAVGGQGVSGFAGGTSGRGVSGESSGASGVGVHGYASNFTGANYGIYGYTNSPNGYGGFFVGRGYFSGNVGIGTSPPAERLHVNGNLRLDGDLKTDRWLGEDSNTFIGVGVIGAGNLSHTGGGTNGYYNTAIGHQALYYNTSGGGNIAVGNEALYDNTSGHSNMAVGNGALHDNTTGFNNTAVGPGTLHNNIQGDSNTAVGMAALANSTSGNDNTVVGSQAGHNSGGSGNVFLGYQAGYNEVGSNKLYIANSNMTSPLIYGEFDNKKFKINGTLGVAGTAQFDLPTSPASMIQISTPGGAPGFVGFATNGNRRDIAVRDEGLALAASDSSSLPNWERGLMIAQTGNVGIGINNTTAYKLYVNGSAIKADGNTHWSIPSDARLKDVDGPYEYGLEEVTKLQPVRFRYKEGNALGLLSDNEHVGLVAQEVQGVIPEAVSEDASGYLSLNGTPIHYAMLNAIKELNAKIEKLENRIKELEKAR